MGDALSTYLPTLGRYIGVLLAVIGSMIIVYRLQVALGVKREAATGRALVTPWVIGFLIFNLAPIGASFYLSFTEYNLFQPPKWVGLNNYKELFSVETAQFNNQEQRSRDVLTRRYREVAGVTIQNTSYIVGAKEEDFWISVRFTLVYALMTVPIGLLGSLAVALLLNQHVRGLSLWRVLFYMPAIIPIVAVALLWRWMFSQNGIINTVFDPLYDLLNMERPRWFTDPKMARPAFLIISLWGVFGVNAVILLAGLKGIPVELYEAAGLDGAGEWSKFRHVTIPMLSPALFYNMVVSTIAALQAFEIAAFIPTSDEVGTFLNWLIFREAFDIREMGMASAMAWILTAIILTLTVLIFRSSQAWVFYQGMKEEGQ